MSYLGQELILPTFEAGKPPGHLLLPFSSHTSPSTSSFTSFFSFTFFLYPSHPFQGLITYFRNRQILYQCRLTGIDCSKIGMFLACPKNNIRSYVKLFQNF